MIASTALPTHVSTASIALIAAFSTPVCPTISGFAKLIMITSYFSDLIASTNLSHTSNALISGCKSYVATFGDFTKIRSSPLFGSSTPPLKKNVTCAYFSVSAILACVISFTARNSPNVFVISVLWKATNLFSIVTSYSVKHTNVVLTLSPLSNPSKLSSQNVLVISLALSGLKLKKMIESFSLIVATGAPSFTITVGNTNSSVFSAS